MRFLIAFFLLFSLAVRAEILEKFDNAAKFSVHNAAKSGVILENAPGGTLLRHCGSMPVVVEIFLRWTGKPYPRIPDGDGICKLVFRSVPPQGVKSIALRMIDQKGEIFQFQSSGIRKNADGSFFCSWKVGDAGWSGSWGHNVDKKVDRPLAFLGFAVAFDSAVPDSELTFLNLQYLDLGSEASAVHLEVDTGDPLFF